MSSNAPPLRQKREEKYTKKTKEGLRIQNRNTPCYQQSWNSEQAVPQPLRHIRKALEEIKQPYHLGRPGMESISTTSRIHISIDRILNTVRLALFRRTSGEENRIPSMASSRSTHNLVLLSIILSPAVQHCRTTP